MIKAKSNLLFKAKLVCQHGLCVGSSAITTLGDPAKGTVYKEGEFLLQGEVEFS